MEEDKWNGHTGSPILEGFLSSVHVCIYSLMCWIQPVKVIIDLFFNCLNNQNCICNFDRSAVAALVSFVRLVGLRPACYRPQAACPDCWQACLLPATDHVPLLP
jgi:hypothetical protein